MSDSSPPPAPARGPRTGITIAMIPLGAIAGSVVALLLEIVVGLIAGAVFSAERPSPLSWRFLAALPSTGALVGAVLLPILYVRSRRP